MTGMDRDRFHLFLRHKNNTTEEDKEEGRWMKMSERGEREKRREEKRKRESDREVHIKSIECTN